MVDKNCDVLGKKKRPPASRLTSGGMTMFLQTVCPDMAPASH